MDITWLIFLLYLAGTFALAWFFSRNESLEEYFLNARSSSLILLVASNVATIIGAGATVAVVAEGYRTGISFGLASVSAYLTGALILIWLTPKICMQADLHGVATLVDYFAIRFDRKVGLVACVVQLCVLGVWIAVQAAAMAGLASVLTGLNYDMALWLAAACTVGYTAIGGLKIDIITDFVQFWTMALVFTIFAVLGFEQVGGFAGLSASVPSAKWSPLGFGGLGWFIGAIVLGGFIYPANSAHWQRLISAPNAGTARKSLILSIPILILFGLVMLFLGQISSVLLADSPGDRALFGLMDKLSRSAVLRGCGYAAVLATIMSSVDSLMVGGSTIIYKAFIADVGGRNANQLRVARRLTAAFGLAGFVLAYTVPAIVTLSLFVVYAALIFVPPLLAGLFSTRFSSRGAFWSLCAPLGLLLLFFPLMPKYSFVVTTLAGTAIVIVNIRLNRRSRNATTS